MKYLKFFVTVSLVVAGFFIAIYSQMNNSFPSQFMPHGSCYYWRPDILFFSVAGNVLAAISYFSIPYLILSFSKAKRLSGEKKALAWLFSSFILACGVVHVVKITTIWTGLYQLEALLDSTTGIVSVITVIALLLNFKSLKEAPTAEDVTRQYEIAELHRVSSLDAVVVHEHGVIREANAKASEIFNIPMEELIGSSPMVKLLKDKDILRVQKRMETEVPGPYQLTIYPVGTSKEIHTVVSPTHIIREGRMIRVTVIRDVTELVELKTRISSLEGYQTDAKRIKEIKADILKKINRG